MPNQVVWRKDCRTSILQGELSYQYLEIPGQMAPITIVAMHGWLDNSATFTPLFQHLLAYTSDRPMPTLRIYAVDFAGHGHSFHRPAGCTYPIWDYGADIAQFIIAKALTNVTLLGHSMGACVAPILAHLLPDAVRAICAIEALGPIANEAQDTAQQLHQTVERQWQQTLRPIKYVGSFEQAVTLRMQGLFPLTKASATLLVERNLLETNEGFRWRSDRRLTLPSPVRFCEPQVHNLLSQLTIPVALITGDRRKQDSRIQQRVACVKDLAWYRLTGSHHLHMQEQVPATAQALLALISKVY